MRIALVTPSPRPLSPGQGGVENVLISWAHELMARGHEVIAVNVSDTQEKEVEAPWKQVQVTHHQHLGDVEADLYSLHQFPAWANATPPNRTISMLHNRPTKDSPFGIFPPAPTWEESLQSLRDAPNLVACSAWLAFEILRLSGREVSGVIHPPVDVAFGRAPAVVKEPFVLLPGRLLWRKGFADMAKLAAQDAFGVPLLITDFAPLSVQPGEANDVRGFLRQTENIQLVDAASTPSDMAQLMARASAVVVPSMGEPFGLVAVEAQASGTRVVAWRDGGLIEAAANATTLVDPGDGEAFAHAVREAVSYPLVSAEVRMEIADTYSASRSVDRLLHYASALAPI